MEWSERRGRRREKGRGGRGKERGREKEGEEGRKKREESGREEGEERKKKRKRKGKEVPILHSQYVWLSCFNSHCPTRA